jgi:hypothetical protein
MLGQTFPCPTVHKNSLSVITLSLLQLYLYVRGTLVLVRDDPRQSSASYVYIESLNLRGNL